MAEREVEVLTDQGQVYKELSIEVIKNKCGHQLRGDCQHPNNHGYPCDLSQSGRCSGTPYVDERTRST
jgi:hypothetical protein